MAETVHEFRGGREVTGLPSPPADGESPGEPEPEQVLPAFPKAAWRGVFGEYRDTMQSATEAPDPFHFSTLLVRAGIELRRRIWFTYGLKLFPNFYCLNFGPTGDRKTTAQRTLPDLGSAPVKIISGAGSGEGLADEFHSVTPGSPCLILIEEFAELLRRGRWDGATVLQFLTTCFDCPPRYELKFRKTGVTIEEPTPSLLAGTTPEWFWASAKLSDFHGGFGNRILYFCGPRNPLISLPAEPDLTETRTQVDRLVSVPGGPGRLSPQATTLWEEFYKAWEQKQQKRDAILQAAIQRIPACILKIAMVYASFEKTWPEINREQLSSAILVGNFSAKCAAELLSLQNAGTNPTKELERRILAYAAQSPGRQTTKRLIYKALWRYYSCAEHFERSFNALVRTGELLAEPLGKGSWFVRVP
jgi:hypothetical protein